MFIDATFTHVKSEIVELDIEQKKQIKTALEKKMKYIQKQGRYGSTFTDSDLVYIFLYHRTFCTNNNPKVRQHDMEYKNHFTWLFINFLFTDECESYIGSLVNGNLQAFGDSYRGLGLCDKPKNTGAFIIFGSAHYNTVIMHILNGISIDPNWQDRYVDIIMAIKLHSAA